MKRFLILSLVVLALSFAAFAKNPKQQVVQTLVQSAMADFGLTGKWAADCSSADSTTFTREGGLVYAYVVFGSAGRNILVYSSAERIDDAHLRVVVSDGDVALTLVILRRSDGRVQTVSSISSDGNVYFKDGLLSDGSEVPSLERCQ